MPFCSPRRCEELVDMLLEAGADVLAVDQKRRTYVHFATAFSMQRAIRAVIAHGCDVNIKVINIRNQIIFVS